jgi:hypothetical protein
VAQTSARKSVKKSRKVEKRVDNTSYLTGQRRGAVLKEEVWYQGSEVVKYSLAYINPRTCGVDNGRVLGYDNSHDHDHRHFMGEVKEIEFPGYEALVDRFQKEVEDLWRAEDEQKR